MVSALCSSYASSGSMRCPTWRNGPFTPLEKVNWTKLSLKKAILMHPRHHNLAEREYLGFLLILGKTFPWEKGYRFTFGMNFSLGEGIGQHNRIFRWYKSLNILFHHLSIATMLASNQPYSHRKLTSPTGLAGWGNFKLRKNKALLL